MAKPSVTFINKTARKVALHHAAAIMAAADAKVQQARAQYDAAAHALQAAGCTHMAGMAADAAAALQYPYGGR